MKQLRNWGLPAMAALSLCLLVAACQGHSKSGVKFRETAFEVSAKKSYDQSEVLNLRLVVNDTYAKATACACIHYLASREYEEFLEILRTDYNIELDLIYCIEEYHLEDSIKTGSYDGAICKPWFVYQYQHETGMKPVRIADMLDPFDNPHLAGVFIVPKKSPIQGPEDINGKKLVIGEPSSFEKYHSAMHLISENDIKPGKIISVSACTEGINALMDKVADVAVISDYALVASCAVDFADEDAFRVVWQTEDIPLCSVMLDLKKVSKNDAARLQAALLDITANKMPERFSSKGFIEPKSWIPKPYQAEKEEN